MTDPSPEPPACEVIVLTALPVEFKAVMRHLEDTKEIVHPSGTIYQHGTFAGAQRTWHIAMAEIGMGGTGAAAEAEKALQFFHPQIAFFVGVAGGLKDVSRGDVVVATKVYAHEAGKAGTRFEPRPDLGHSSHALEQRARAEAHGKEWLTRLESNDPDPAPQVFIGAIAAGEKVLSSKKSSLARLLKRTYGDALAIEMEGHGFLHAVHLNHAVQGLVIRGISDLVDDKAEADASGWQAIAARHAAAFAFQVLADFTLPALDLGQAKIPPAMLPPQAQSFVGREEEIDWLLHHFAEDTGKTLGLCGPGGMGKTALAAEALRRFTAQPDWPLRFPGGIFYHSFYTFPQLPIAFEELAHFLGEEPGADAHRTTLRALSRRRTLLVFDGLEVLDDTLALRRLGGKHVVLLLSRRQSDAPVGPYRRDLHLLSAEQGIALLQHLAGERAADRPSVERLVELIGGYPLALHLIGGYLSSRQEEVANYVQWFEWAGLTSLDHGKHQAQSVPVLLERTCDALMEIEQQVFVLLGLLAPAPFPFELVQALLEISEQAVRQALGSLVNFSVLRRPDQDYEVSHPLVHTFAKERLSSQIDALSSDITERLLGTLLAHFEQSNPYDRTALALWSPHVVPLLSATDLTTSQRLSVAHLFNDVGFAAHMQGKYGEAEPLYVRALEIHEQELGAAHPDTAISLNNLATLYYKLEKYAEAESLYQRALAIWMRTNNPETASVLNNLAELYRAQKKDAEVELLYKRALAICEREWGASHPIAAFILDNLGTLYREQGKYTEAEPLLLQALEIRQQKLGVGHPNTALSLNNLAALYDVQGKYVEAEPLYQLALTIYEQTLGANHPDMAASLNNLAGFYYFKQRKYVEAEPLLLQELAIYEQTLEATHPLIARVLNNLAALYCAQGKYADAEPLLLRALAIYEQTLEATHPFITHVLNSLVELYRAQDKDAEAEPFYQRALVIQKQTLERDHHNTLLAQRSYDSPTQKTGQDAQVTAFSSVSAQYYHQRKGTRKKAKNKMAKKSRRNNRNR